MNVTVYQLSRKIHTHQNQLHTLALQIQYTKMKAVKLNNHNTIMIWTLSNFQYVSSYIGHCQIKTNRI